MFCSKHENWVFTLDEDFVWKSNLKVPRNFNFHDKKGHIRLKLRKPNLVIVTKKYSWDGCTPKFYLFDILLGTPDGVIDSGTKKPKTFYASLVHDIFYQFLLDGLPFNRLDADNSLLKLMGETGFKPRRIYWLGVRLFGWLFVLHHRHKRKNKGTFQLVSGK